MMNDNKLDGIPNLHANLISFISTECKHYQEIIRILRVKDGAKGILMWLKKKEMN